MSDNYADETKPLFKLLRTEAFRFIIVRYNHFSLVQQLEKDIQQLFPDRPCLKIDAEKTNYQSLTNNYFSLQRGFLFIENFDDVLKEQFDSQNKETPQFQIENERRRGITAGLNLRRDKLAKYPIAMFVFVPASTDALYAKIIMEKMPDLWSFRSIILDLERETISNIEINNDIRFRNKDLNKIKVLDQDDTELRDLLSLLENTPESEIAFRLTLYPQIVDAAKAVGDYKLAFSTLEQWEKHEHEDRIAWIWIQKGDILAENKQFNEALFIYKKALKYAESTSNQEFIGLGSERLGDVYAEIGKFEKALPFFEQYYSIEKNLVSLYPFVRTYKSNLAISNEKLGSLHSSLGDFDKALIYFQNASKIVKELYLAYPNNLDFKKELAISYSKLGDTFTNLGNSVMAMNYFEDVNILFKELYAAYPKHLEFTIGLAMSYAKIGGSHTNMGNLEKALTFFEKCNELSKELYDVHPNNIEFKSNFAESISVLYAILTLLNKNPNISKLEEAIMLFHDLLNQGKAAYYRRKIDICKKMKEPNADFKQLIVQIISF